MYSVFVCDLFHASQPDHEIEVPGFPTREVAIAYARRRLRASIEENRAATPEETREKWRIFGEDCRVVGPEGVVYLASAEAQRYFSHPSSPQDCDYLGLYRTLLPSDFSLECTWAAASMPPPHHYEYQISISANGAGRLRFIPDYPSHDVPVWEEQFQVPLSRRVYLHTLLREANLLPPPPNQDDDSPVGGASLHLSVTSQGEQADLSAHRLPSEAADRLRDIHKALRDTVPQHVWNLCTQRREAYIAARYE